MSRVHDNYRAEFMEEMRQDALEEDYHEKRYIRRMLDWDDTLFEETVEQLADESFTYAITKLKDLCNEYDRDYDGWFEYLVSCAK